MPNWCANEWTVHGPETLMDKFLESIASAHDAIDFNRFRPTTRNDYDVSEQYAKWGTKWNPTDVTIERSHGCAKIVFMTAWRPPFASMIREFMSMNCPDMVWKLVFVERGADFYGTFSSDAQSAGEDLKADFKPSDFEATNELNEDAEDAEGEEQPKLRQHLSYLQHLFDMSG